MITIGVFPNIKKPSVRTVLAWMIQYLKEKHVRVVLPKEAAEQCDLTDMAFKGEDFAQMNFALTLGGDGTLLSTARQIAPYNIPLCGINMGQLGFLTEVEIPELRFVLEKLISGEYTIEDRTMLCAIVLRGEEELYVSCALNDIVITKSGFSRLIRLGLYIDNVLTANYPADGLIVATSTGSTGYSLSAGGPIINPKLKVILLTPICPHTLHARSLVISEDEEVKITTQATHDNIVLTVDGQKVFNLKPEDQVYIKRAPYRAKFIRVNNKSYYETLQAKLRRGDSNAKL